MEKIGEIFLAVNEYYNNSLGRREVNSAIAFKSHAAAVGYCNSKNEEERKDKERLERNGIFASNWYVRCINLYDVK